MDKILITYNTSSQYKREEIEHLKLMELETGQPIGSVFDFHFTSVPVKEDLEVDIGAMVTAEVRKAYAALKVPCIVEHAGLVFDDYSTSGYPGGLTKPMWDTLGDKFLEETNSANRRASAVAKIGYCDGMSTRVFSGETRGSLSDAPRGSRSFYWDTVFIPDDDSGTGSQTYSEIVANAGFAGKLALSQSARAFMEFLTYRLAAEPQLWKLVQ